MIIPAEGMKPSDYFTLYPQIHQALPDYVGFSTQVLFPHHQERDVLKVELAIGHDEMGRAVVAFLDLDYFLAQPGSVLPPQALVWVNAAHDTVEHAFEACITDRLRAQFDQES